MPFDPLIVVIYLFIYYFGTENPFQHFARCLSAILFIYLFILGLVLVAIYCDYLTVWLERLLSDQINFCWRIALLFFFSFLFLSFPSFLLLPWTWRLELASLFLGLEECSLTLLDDNLLYLSLLTIIIFSFLMLVAQSLGSEIYPDDLQSSGFCFLCIRWPIPFIVYSIACWPWGHFLSAFLIPPCFSSLFLDGSAAAVRCQANVWRFMFAGFV